MGKKAETIMDKSIPILLNRKQQLHKVYQSESLINIELEKDIVAVCNELRKKSMRELQSLHKQVLEEKVEIMQQHLASNEHKNEINSDEEENTLDLKLQIIKNAIELKKEYQKQSTHPVERHIIRHGVFSSSTPNESTLKKMRDSSGAIEQIKTGFKKLYYKNDNGNFLTSYDTKTFIGLLKLWELKGKQRIIEFDFIDLLKLGMEVDVSGGKEYKQLAESLKNIASTSIIMEDYADPTTLTEFKSHTLIQNSHIIHKNGIAKATLELNNLLHKSLLDGNYILINMSLFNDLATATSRNLYLYIVNEIPEGHRILDIDPLIGYLGLQPTNRSKAIGLITEAFKELSDFNVIKNFDVLKEGRFYRSFTYEPSEWLDKNKILPHNQHIIGLSS